MWFRILRTGGSTLQETFACSHFQACYFYSPAPPVQFNATEGGRTQIGQVSNDLYEDPDKMKASILSGGFHNQGKE